MDYSYLKLTNMFKYSYPVSNLNINLMLGISNAFAVSEYNNVERYSYTYGSSTYYEGKLLQSTTGYEQGLVGGMGLGFKGIGISVRHEKSTGISFMSALKSPVSRTYFLLSYTFH